MRPPGGVNLSAFPIRFSNTRTMRDIVDALVEDGVEGVTKSMVELERPIKALGLIDVKVKLYPEVAVTVGVTVARSPDEAEMQRQGIDVIAAMFQEDQAETVAPDLDPDRETALDNGSPPRDSAPEEGPAADA